jgi:hypothetical protein
MNTKIISVTILLFCAALTWLWLSNSTHSDQSSPAAAMTQERGYPGHQTIKTQSAAPQPQGSDTNQPSSTTSLLPRDALNEMQNTAEETKRLLMSAPDDMSGKQSRWFKPLSDWQAALSKAAKTGTRSDLLALVPTAAAFFARDREAEPLAEPLDEMRHWMQHPAPSIIRELASAAIEGAGSFDDDTASIALQVFTVRGFVSEPDWEDERMPLDAPGVVIALADNTESLEALPAKQIARLVQSGDAQTFFRRYEKGGDGLPVLQQQFAEKRHAIISLFGGLAAKAAAYQASTETEK